MQKLLLEFSDLSESQLVKIDFERELPFEVLLSANSNETAKILDSKTIHLIVLQTCEFREGHVKRVTDLRRMGYAYSILVLQEHSSPLSEKLSKKESKIAFIDKPYDMKTLRGMVRKLMTARTISRQQFRRYRTNQKVSLQTFVTGENVETKMLNLSKGGAYFELAEKSAIGVGELLRLKFNLDQVEKEHHIHGRIVWTTPKGHFGGGYGIGVKFIKSEDIYRHLLQGV